MYRQRKKFLKTKAHILTIQRFWKKTYPLMKLYKKIKFYVKKLGKYAEEMYKKKTKAAICIQKFYKKYKVRKEYKDKIYEKVKITMHEKLLRRQSKLVQDRNRKKQAVKVIEREWLKRMKRQRMRSLRKYLATIPYECRVLCLKYKQAKRETDVLQADLNKVIKTSGFGCY
ncbi:hypothetical protein SteCoe_13333 [Stentor coeruleus]|uniref:Uncharacterized protein n=1 Tax=Stentor coeruleus TaxID=5963 RepID=A0A1R2C8R3_9CILI|nr:hypothetical protein SteCoe_13333 [Stentor coeruleus]